MSEQRFDPINSATVVGCVVGLLGGMGAEALFARHQGSIQYNTAANNILNDQGHIDSLEYSRSALTHNPSAANYENAVKEIDVSIAHQRRDIKAQTEIEHKTHYNPNEDFGHMLEFAFSGVFLMGAIAAVGSKKFYNWRHRKPTEATPALS